MMKGRDLFKILKPVLRVLSAFFKILPNFIVSFLWDITSIFGGKLFVGVRYVLLKAKAESVGENVYVGKYVVIKGLSKLTIGDNVSIHDSCYIDATGRISIGNEVSIAHNSSILSAEHSWQSPEIPIKYNPEILKETVIGNDIWIGCGVRILGGVTIGDRSIVAAGCIVNRNVGTSSLVGGVPVKFIKSI